MSTFINEKTQKTLSVSTNENGNQRKNVLMSTNENAISQKTFFVSTKLDKYKDMGDAKATEAIRKQGFASGEMPSVMDTVRPWLA